MKTNTEIAKSIISDIKWTIEAYEKSLKRFEAQSDSIDDKVLQDLDNTMKKLKLSYIRYFNK